MAHTRGSGIGSKCLLHDFWHPQNLNIVHIMIFKKKIKIWQFGQILKYKCASSSLCVCATMINSASQRWHKVLSTIVSLWIFDLAWQDFKYIFWGHDYSLYIKIYIVFSKNLICGIKVTFKKWLKIKVIKSKIHNDTIVDNSFVHLWLAGFIIVAHTQRARGTFVFQDLPKLSDFNFFRKIIICTIFTFWGCQKSCNKHFDPIPEPLVCADCHYHTYSFFVETPSKIPLFEKSIFKVLSKILSCGLYIEISDAFWKTSDGMWSPSQILS